MKTRIVALNLFFYLSYSVNLFAQEPINNPYQPPVFTQSSPEAAAFQRYGDVPVSLYTGVPDISIPLHTIKVKDMTVPISLSYHAGGITVDQEATVVGLGWSLMAGGTITVSAAGARDIPNMLALSKWQETINYIADNSSSIISSGYEDWYSNFACTPDNENRQTDALALHYATANGMGEQDIYTVTLPHRTFKFYLHPETNEAIFVGEKNKCEIVYSGWNFFITDEYGVKYSFTVYEEDAVNHLPNIWYLTKIEDVNRNEINFEYQISQYAVIGGAASRFSERMVLWTHERFPPPPARSFSAIGDGIPSIQLDAIRTNTEEVIFTYQTGRRDGGSRLKEVKVIDRQSGVLKKYYRLNHGYFESSNVGAAYFNNDNPYPSGADWDSRLKLESLSQVNPLQHADTVAYQFSYDERHQLPPKSTFARDFWGFYNGQENSSSVVDDGGHTLLPDPRVMEHIQPDFASFNWKGWFWAFDELTFANRLTHPEFVTTATLKSITYPTGGRTEFEFEPHTFHNQKMFEAAEQAAFLGRDTIISVADMNDPYGVSQTMAPFTLDEATEVSFSGGGDSTAFDLSGGSIRIIDVSGGDNHHIYDLDEKSRWDVQLTLPAGDYLVACDAPSGIPFQNYKVIVWARVEYRIFDRDSINAILSRTEGVGGGLRVKRIVDYDGDARTVRATEYRYENEGGGASGRLLRRMDNFRLEPMRYSWKDGELEFTTQVSVPNFYADNILPVHNATSNAMVGYDRVVVKRLSETEGGGAEISYFHNERSSITTLFDLFDICINGTLKQQVLLDNNSDTVKRTDYYYEQHHYAKKWHNMLVRDQYTGPTDICIDFINPLAFIGRYHIIAYAYTNFVNHLVRTETYDYSANARLLVRKENIYDTANYQLDEVKTLTSGNERRISRYSYPHDYPGDFAYPTIVGRNMINPVIEQREYLDDKLLKTQENRLWLWFNSQNVTTIAPSRVRIGFSENPVEDKIFFDKYDLQGNVLQYHMPDDSLFTVVCRGYGDDRVVAVIIGEATYDQVHSTAGTYLDQLDDNLSNAQLESVNTSIRSLLPDALVTTYTYDPVYGLTSETDPNGMTTYYEYDAFGRLALVKDDDGNILKHVEYHYQK